MRFAIAGIVHESNSFAPEPTGYDKFRVLDGPEIVRLHADAASTATGYLNGCADLGVEAVPLYLAQATPAGPIPAESFERLCDEMLDTLRSEGPWDGVLLYLHGAAVAEGQDDADGEITRRVRDLVGTDVPIAVTLDMHANVSPGMVAHSDVLVVWRTNPHVDPEPRAREAAHLAIRTARGEIRPVMHLEQVPAALNILRQDTSTDPMRTLLLRLGEVLAEPGVLSASLAEGYPWADVAAMGMATVVITDDEPTLAARLASELARHVWAERAEFDGSAVPVDEEVRTVDATTMRPVLMLDVGDNIGGGSPGDSVTILAEVIRQGASGFVASIHAADAVAICAAAGVGEGVDLTVGAATDPSVGPPVRLLGKVVAVDDGRFEDPNPTHGGRRYYDAGPTAVLDIGDDNRVILTSSPMGSHSPVQLTSLGLDPASFKGIVAKGVNSPLAGYRPVVADILFVDTPGCTAADLSSLSFSRRRVPMTPFEPDTVFAAGA